MRASINGLISVYRELDPEALAAPGKRRRKVGQLGKHVPPFDVRTGLCLLHNDEDTTSDSSTSISSGMSMVSFLGGALLRL